MLNITSPLLDSNKYEKWWVIPIGVGVAQTYRKGGFPKYKTYYNHSSYWSRFDPRTGKYDYWETNHCPCSRCSKHPSYQWPSRWLYYAIIDGVVYSPHALESIWKDKARYTNNGKFYWLYHTRGHPGRWMDQKFNSICRAIGNGRITLQDFLNRYYNVDNFNIKYYQAERYFPSNYDGYLSSYAMSYEGIYWSYGCSGSSGDGYAVNTIIYIPNS